jgi:hypothetical protein
MPNPNSGPVRIKAAPFVEIFSEPLSTIAHSPAEPLPEQTGNGGFRLP